ncbi:MAG: endonuclease III [Nanoarchaeota archaeon]|nr:endonuclease III [Nanoarchaeota archaeon]
MKSASAIKQLKAIQKLVRKKDMRLAAEWNSKYKILIATILSAQTRDETTIAVCENLFKKYPSMTKLSKVRISSIEKIIRKVNYHKTKAKNIIATAKMLAGRKIPETTEELLVFPGVGRKVANVYMAEAHNADVIGVDTHVKRISYKLGWTKSKNPNRIEKDLMKLFPKSYWGKINDYLVRFGRTIGRSRKREDETLTKLIN